MDWIPALLKHLALSRSIIAAAFVAAAVLYAGPRIAPAYVDPVPREWAAVLVAVLVFSGFLLATWGASAVWVLVKRRWVATGILLASHQIDHVEMMFLLALGENPREPLNLDEVDYENLQFSRLAVFELVHGLQKKGLISINPYSSKLISLTSTGRQRALTGQRQAANNAT